jgi:hypothetical protein
VTHFGRVAVLLVLASTLVACRSESNLGSSPMSARPQSDARLEVRRKHDPDTGMLLHEWTLAYPPGKSSVKHGKETIWNANGVKQWEREYKYGKPYGAWRSWYESGKPRSECFYGDPEVDTRMTFWHANGQISLQGPARNASRRGEWKIWYANGQLAEQGKFVDSQREGEWLAWSEDGSEAWKRTYKRNIRVAQVPISQSSSVESRSAPQPSIP